ncbi:MAG: 5'/3'-nucleotidase SurE [Firmicutes bacterium]|nr:5'/3'-nucleotidase SurE [Bacillota bacterium]
MNILVVNDDGIRSPGLRALVEALKEKANVFVCAPDGQRSAKSHSITLGENVYIQPVEYPGAKGALQTSGTPADCTKIGLQFFEEEGNPIDMVYSGINLGSNLGWDTLYSGTVGAAAEAAMSGIHGVAVSVASHDASHFDAAGQLAVAMLDLVYGKVDPRIVMNINTPDLPKDQIKGIKVVPLGQRYYDDKFHLVDENQYTLSGNPADYSEAGAVDVTAVHGDYATITPLQFDFTDRQHLDLVKEWNLSL